MSAAEGDYTRGGVGRYVVSRLICCGHVGDRDSAVQADLVAEVWKTLYVWLLGRPTSGKGGQKWAPRFIELYCCATLLRCPLTLLWSPTQCSSCSHRRISHRKS